MIGKINGNLQMYIGEFLSSSDVCSLMLVCRIFRHNFESNMIWKVLYRRRFPIWIIGPSSIHSYPNVVLCDSPCLLLSHHTQLKEKKKGNREYVNFRRQYVRRVLTIDKRMLKPYVNLSHRTITVQIKMMEEQVKAREAQLTRAKRQCRRMRRVKRLRLDINGMFKYLSDSKPSNTLNSCLH
jgi:hypothetical protein